MDLHPFRFPFRAMGSPCHLILYAASETEAQSVAREVIEDVQALEARYSRYRPDSLLSRVNRLAGRKGGVAVDEELAALLDYARTCYEQSDGLFDVTSGILRQAWNFSSDRLPEQRDIDALLERVGWDKLRWERPVLKFEVPGMELDFGGIGKEYAADRASTRCLERGITAGVVNFGGDLRVIGPHPDGAAWEVGINHPREPGKLLATLSVRSGAVTTSGDYERCIVVDGKRYGHILNPRTGWPVEGLASVSVAAPHALVAGSACTIAMLKAADGPEWLRTLGLPALWMDGEGRVGQLAANARQAGFEK
ncbi:FAD:protein FMN transferase [Methylococcus geothermalis]|uniref:FAD:protein FMN transferase n=1 Tax=Methylococcus geothermalis TaxID=2681310 RepID=A0A858Q6S4_9GAMM|nr:FAD:protein FMN transferase [Methylococcus geothermalis]QJD29539.1 FAD:protein FMN transferase [Methylococcus geothermalis]